MKKVVVGIVGAVALTSISMAMAGGMTSTVANDQSSSNSAGLYVNAGLGIGSVNLYHSNDFTGFSSYSYRNYAFAWAANLGYQFNSYLALEAGYLSFGEMKATFTPIAGMPSTTVRTSFGGFDAVVKGILPLSDSFSLYGKVGAIDMHATQSASLSNVTINSPHASTWAPLMGLGAAYNVNNNVAVTLEDDLAFGTRFKQNGVTTVMPAANAVLAGVSYKFSM